MFPHFAMMKTTASTFNTLEYYVGHWAVELGRIDIASEVSMMATYGAAP
jgi:hypothetical protein